MPSVHAIISPSSLNRIIECPPSLAINRGHSQDTAATREGTKAHAVAELALCERYGLPKDPASVEEAATADRMMTVCGDMYCDFISQLYDFYHCHEIHPETRVELGDYLPECWGTCDCYMVSEDAVIVVDYKYGKALVRAESNAQLRAYALGAVLASGADVKRVIYYIFQPRSVKDYSGGYPCPTGQVGSIVHEELGIKELLQWAAHAKPAIEAALSGSTEYRAGAHCAFCAGRGVCQAQKPISLEESMTLLDGLS